MYGHCKRQSIEWWFLATKRVGPKLLHAVKHSLWGGPPFLRENVVKAPTLNTWNWVTTKDAWWVTMYRPSTFQGPNVQHLSIKKHTTVTSTSATHFLPIVPFGCSWSNPPSLHLPRLSRQFTVANATNKSGVSPEMPFARLFLQQIICLQQSLPS